MEKDNVIDIKTKHPIFKSPLRESLEDGVAPFLKDPEDRTKTITTLEQIVCAALVSAAGAIATKVANSLVKKLTNS